MLGNSDLIIQNKRKVTSDRVLSKGIVQECQNKDRERDP